MTRAAELDLEDLVAYCRDELGERLRLVSVLEDGDLANVYFRDDVEQRYPRDKLREISEAFLAIGREFDGLYTNLTPLGQKEAVVLTFQEAHVFLFPISDETTVLLSVDREAGENLSLFIRHCSNELYKL